MCELRIDAFGLRLRATHPHDIAFVCAAETAEGNREFVEQWSESQHLACLHGGDCRHLVIEDESGNRAGFVILQGLEDPDTALLLRRIVVTQKGEGIGGRAVEAIKRHCFETLRFRRLWLEVHDDNLPARTLYEHHGFRVESVQRSAHAQQSALRMVLDEHDYRRSSASEKPDPSRA